MKTVLTDNELIYNNKTILTFKSPSELEKKTIQALRRVLELEWDNVFFYEQGSRTLSIVIVLVKNSGTYQLFVKDGKYFHSTESSDYPSYCECFFDSLERFMNREAKYHGNRIVPVHAVCRINQENATPAKEDTLIAVNITSLDETSNFKHFVLAIDDFTQCCENYGVTITGDYKEDMEVFVKQVIFGDHDCVIELKDGKAIYASVYNNHNGYYAHKIFTDLNGELHINYL